MSLSDPLQQYTALRDAIVTEREQLVIRLREIDDAMGFTGLRGHGGYHGANSRSMPRNNLSLKEAVLKVIDGKSMTKDEILHAVLALDYKFTTDDPMNSLGVVLYGKKPKFKNNHGKFSL